jgi:hypothetical protein
MKSPIEQVVTDIRALSLSIQRRWARRDNALVFGNLCDAERLATTVDMRALRNCIEWALENPAGGMRGYRAAVRLDAVLEIIERHQTEIQQQLRAA